MQGRRHNFQSGGGGGGGGFVTTAQSAQKVLILLYPEPLKSAISSNYFPNLLHIFGYPTMITVNKTRISCNFNNPIYSK